MHDRGKSDDLVVPAKLPNNALVGVAEVVEGRGSPDGDAASSTLSGLSAGQSALSGLERVRRLARKDFGASSYRRSWQLLMSRRSAVGLAATGALADMPTPVKSDHTLQALP
jgi:hypothetical protein